MTFARFVVALGAVALAGCSSSDATPSACSGSSCTDASGAAETGTPSPDAASDALATDAISDGAADDVTTADAHCTYVDEAGVTQGCGAGSMGGGDHDDGGDQDVAPPSVALDAGDLSFGSSCWDDAQCSSNICYDFRAKGQFCTQTCSVDTDCPQVGSLGCNGMGLCRVGSE